MNFAGNPESSGDNGEKEGGLEEGERSMRGEEGRGGGWIRPAQDLAMVPCWMSGRSEGYACHGLPPIETGSFGVYGYCCEIVGVCCVRNDEHPTHVENELIGLTI